jgi:putative endonuclease
MFWSLKFGYWRLFGSWDLVIGIFTYSSVAQSAERLPAGRQGWLLTVDQWFIYALRSLKDNNLYIGISRNPEKRVEIHNKGKTESTQNRRPFVLIHKESCNSLKETREKEKHYKSGFGREILKQIIPR